MTMQLLKNPHRGYGLSLSSEMQAKRISVDADTVRALLRYCPINQATPLLELQAYAAELGVERLYLKDERERMGLGSFKATGAAYVIASAAIKEIEKNPGIRIETLHSDELKQVLNGHTYISSSAGNHGLSIAAGARIFGARAVIYLAQNVAEAFAERLRGYGAEVVREGEDYEQSMAAAIRRAEIESWTLLSDSSWPGYTDIPGQVMEGYLLVAAEICEQLQDKALPTHVFLQAGVGGLAAAMTAYFRKQWGDAPIIVVVEPDAAPALYASVEAGKAVLTQGPASVMGRLDCKAPSHLALAELSRQADWFVTLTDARVNEAVTSLNKQGIDSTASGVAGIAVLQQSCAGDEVREKLGISGECRILAIITEKSDS